MLYLRLFGFLFCCYVAAAPAAAQDLHYSQFTQHPLHYNPAHTGVFEGTWRAGAIYRGQWLSVPVNYRSFAGAFDYKFARHDRHLIAAGILLQHDDAGDGGLAWNQLGLSASAAHALGEEQALSVGFSLGLAQRSVDLGSLKFKNQWNGDVFDPSAPSGETLNRSSGLSPSFAAGLCWQYRSGEYRHSADIGAGATHLNRPRINFAEDAEQRLPVRLSVAARGNLQMTEQLDLTGFALGQLMGQNREIIAGGGLRRWLDATTAVQFSLAMRLGDAVIPCFQLEREGWTFGLSYDWNISGFDVATRGRGGLELSAVYRSLPAPAPRATKSCPIF
ncbi:MAG TPA: PorP/SprF family type IX secretion system membrane protein [Saprospiraceae bacterium]|nr:PorP/SprF family type IX secretion system membrane protein [Saprospiraceae bacterium]